MARSGFIGPATIFEGRDGFLQGYSGDPDPSLVLKDLGDEYQITRTSIKPHTCCRYKQGPIDCLLDIKRTHAIEAADVSDVAVGVLSAGYNIISSPEEDKANPQTVVDMQFSMPFGAAVALAYGRASLNEYAPGVQDRAEVRRLLPLVRSVTDPELDAHFPCEWRAWAEVSTADGRRLRSDILHPKGDPENALSWAEMKDKFDVLTATVISPQCQQQIIAAIESLDEMKDVRELAALLSTE